MFKQCGCDNIYKNYHCETGFQCREREGRKELTATLTDTLIATTSDAGCRLTEL